MTPLAALASIAMGFTLGLLGGGGSIMAVPILVYLLGVETKSAIATSLVVVGSTAIMGLMNHARSGNVVWRTGVIFGGFAMLGAFAGGKLAHYVPGQVLLGIFAVLMLGTALAMRRGRSDAPEGVAPAELPLAKIAAEGIVLGCVTGLVGAGGGFLVVPALVLLGGLPMRKAIGTSLLVITMNSAAGVAGYLTHAEIDWHITGVVVGLAVAGSFAGSAMSRRVDASKLRSGFAYFVLVMGVAILLREVPLAPGPKAGLGAALIVTLAGALTWLGRSRTPAACADDDSEAAALESDGLAA
ncbi:MAG: sulfite exporter TauE/SafE family protein [Myxococcales bacterium]|nr:sulfite exporter TauE/SafE family protein [Myxococcales bacterium]